MRIIDQRWLPHELRIVPLCDRAAFATAIREMWARGAPLDEMTRVLAPLAPGARAAATFTRAAGICDEDVEMNRRIGLHGLAVIRQTAARKGGGRAIRARNCRHGS